MKKRLPVCRGNMFTDLEGIYGVDNWDPRHAAYANEARRAYERCEMQRLLTAEVNATAKGCLDAGGRRNSRQRFS